MNVDALDLERDNFLTWYRTATPDDLVRARANGAEKLDELLMKYAGEVRIIAAIKGVAQAARLRGNNVGARCPRPF